MPEVYVVRISPRAQTLSFKHPLVSRVIRRPVDTRDPTKGWVMVDEDEARILRKVRVGGSSDAHAPPLFDVMTQEEAVQFQQAEMARLGLGTPENPVGGSPLQTAEIAKLKAEMAAMKAESATQNQRIINLLTMLAAKNDPALAAQLKGIAPGDLNLELNPGVSAPDSAIDPPPAEEAVVSHATNAPAPPAPSKQASPHAAAAAPPASPKQRPGGPAPAAPAPQQGAKEKAPKQQKEPPPESLTAKMRAEGKIGKATSEDIAEDDDA